jgi:putative ABC transport system permease protein
MFKNYFISAWRNLAKQKGLSFISVFGLALGIACFSLFALYALNEFNFDSFNKNAANVFRVYNWHEGMNGNDAGGNIYLPMPLGPAIKQDVPGVENYVRYVQPYEMFIKTNGEGRRESVGFADPAFFSVFSFKLRYGNPATALSSLNSIVLAEDAAKRIFGTTDVVGKSLEVKAGDSFDPFTVTAVAENPPSNSSFQFSMLASMQYLATTPEGKMGANNWHWASYLTFIEVKPGSMLAHDKVLPVAFREKYFPSEEKDMRKRGWDGKGAALFYRLEPLREIHTDIQLQGTRIPPVDPKMIWILVSIASGVLLIACINFTTLAIGRSAGRAKEVGVRKVIGGTKKTLVFQFLTEAMLLTVISAIAGLLLANMLLPFFNVMAGRELRFSFTQFPQLTTMFAGLIFTVGLLSGTYPSLVLSRFKPVEVLKTKVKLGSANFFTKSLVTVQFVVSAGLIISAVVIIQQLHYMQTKYPGFNKENVVVVEALGVDSTKKIYPLFKQALASHPEITGTASAENGLGEDEGLAMNMFTYNNTKPIGSFEYYIDQDYIPVLGMQMAAGRNFNAAIATDTSTAVIINEVMMNDLGLTYKNVVGQRLTGYRTGGEQPVIIGVVKNFNYMDLKQKVTAQMFYQFPNHTPYRFFVRIQPGGPSKALASIEAAWKKVAPAYPLRYNFLDEDLNRFYQNEQRLGSIITWAGGISVFLACLGLLGLASLAAINRIKEIGIRKILGASLSSIVGLLTTDFIKLVLVAFVIATPLAWYFMNKWLQDYAYRINIEWWVFAVTGAATVLVALVATGYQAIKAGVANPVDSLRTE